MLRPQDTSTRERKSLSGLWQFALDPAHEGRSAAWQSGPLADGRAMAVQAPVTRDENRPSVLLSSLADEPESDTEADDYFRPLFDAAARPTRPGRRLRRRDAGRALPPPPLARRALTPPDPPQPTPILTPQKEFPCGRSPASPTRSRPTSRSSAPT